MSLVQRVKDAAKANPKVAAAAALIAAYWLYKKATTRKNDVRGKVFTGLSRFLCSDRSILTACVAPPSPPLIFVQIVLITGGGSGLGRLMAIKFALLGSRVVLWDINTKGLEAVAQEIQSEVQKAARPGSAAAAAAAPSGGADSKSSVVYTYVCDVSNSQSVSTMAERVKAEVYVFCRWLQSWCVMGVCVF